MAHVLVLVAHPDLGRSRVNRALLEQARALPPEQVEVRDLYALYPDFDLDVAAEQRALAAARAVVWVHPLQWYSMPALMKLWVDEVLAFRWAYGPGGQALAGKCLWLVVSTGGAADAYRDEAGNPQALARFLPPYVQTAELVGMRFLEPKVFHGAHRADQRAVLAHARAFADSLRELAAGTAAGLPAPQPDIAADERRPND